MKRPFREHHLFTLLNGYNIQQGPLDVYISLYFKENKALGSKDRAFVADNAYALMRWKGLLDALGKANWEDRWDQLQQIDPFKTPFPSLPDHVRVSFPKELFEAVEKTLGKEKTIDFCLACNRPAPTT